MNYFGSYKRLLGNSKSAMIAAIEVYNKPTFPYRDEVFVVMLVNAWELGLKAIVSKSKQSLYYPKKRNEPYKTLSCKDAYWKAANSEVWPAGMDSQAIKANLDMIIKYRDQTVHFYSDSDMGYLMYSLSQAAIVNYRDLMERVFGRDILAGVDWRIMPLAFSLPVDPLQLLRSNDSTSDGRPSRHVQEFLAELEKREDDLLELGEDPGRMWTAFNVTLQSIKKIDKADVVAGVTREPGEGVVFLEKKVNVNQTHPYRLMDMIPLFKEGRNRHDFLAASYAYNMREDESLMWKDDSSDLVKWSRKALDFFNDLPDDSISRAREKYGRRNLK